MLLRRFLRARIAGATATAGSTEEIDTVRIDADLLDAADLDCLEQVELRGVDAGWRLTAHILSAPRGSGVIEIHGSQMTRFRRRERVTISAWADIDRSEIATVRARVVEVDHANRVVEVRQLRITDEP